MSIGWTTPKVTLEELLFHLKHWKGIGSYDSICREEEDEGEKGTLPPMASWREPEENELLLCPNGGYVTPKRVWLGPQGTLQGTFKKHHHHGKECPWGASIGPIIQTTWGGGSPRVAQMQNPQGGETIFCPEGKEHLTPEKVWIGAQRIRYGIFKKHHHRGQLCDYSGLVAPLEELQRGGGI